MLRNNRGQIFTLIEILVVVAIVVGAGLWLAQNYTGGEGNRTERVDTPTERAQSVACQNNLQQIRYAITMYSQTNERPPATLAEAAQSGGLSESMLKCDVSGKPYNYDPNTGKVWCTTPGHERY